MHFCIIQTHKYVQLTDKCWKSHALIIFVATLGKMPRFFCCRLLPGLSSESSSAVPSPEPILLSMPSPAAKEQC